MAPARCSTLPPTTNLKITTRLLPEPVITTQRLTISPTIEVVTTHKSLKILPNCWFTSAQTPWPAVTNPTVSSGTALAGEQRRTCTVTCTAQPIGTTSTNQSPSTSQSSKLLMVALSGKSKSLMLQTNEDESETCYMTVRVSESSFMLG